MEMIAGPLTGFLSEPLQEGGEMIQPIGERILGRVALEDIKDPFTGEILVEAEQEIDEAAWNGLKTPVLKRS